MALFVLTILSGCSILSGRTAASVCSFLSSGYGHIYAMLPGIAKSLPDLLCQKPDHADSVLKLQVPVIAFFAGKISSCHDIPLVTCVDQMNAVPVHIVLLPSLDLIYDPAGRLRVKRLQLRQALSVSGKAYRNDRYAPKLRKILLKLSERVFQFISVIDPPAQDDLSVQLDPCLLQAADLRKDIAGGLIAQHLAAKLRIHGMK